MKARNTVSEQSNEGALTVEQVAEIVRQMSPAEMTELVRLVPELAGAVQGVVSPSPPGDNRPTHVIWLERLKGMAIGLKSGGDEGES